MAMNLPTILTGAAVTAAVGTAAYMMTGKKKNTAKQLKKKAGKAVQAVGDIVEGISNIRQKAFGFLPLSGFLRKFFPYSQNHGARAV